MIREIQIPFLDAWTVVMPREKVLENTIFIGGELNAIEYEGHIVFQMPELEDKESIQSATLKMYCENHWNWTKHMQISINHDNIKKNVTNNGFYTWDITSLVTGHHEPLLECIAYTKHDKGPFAKKIFSTFPHSYAPVLGLEIYKEPFIPPPKPDLDTFVQTYTVTDEPGFTKWLTCHHFRYHYFFVENEGHTPVEIDVQISPDRHMVYKDYGTAYLKAGSTGHMESIRRSAYIRLRFKSQTEGEHSKIKVFFQGIGILS